MQELWRRRKPTTPGVFGRLDLGHQVVRHEFQAWQILVRRHRVPGVVGRHAAGDVDKGTDGEAGALRHLAGGDVPGLRVEIFGRVLPAEREDRGLAARVVARLHPVRDLSWKCQSNGRRE